MSLCCFQRSKVVLAHVLSSKEHSNEFWLAQSCFVAKWNFMLYWPVWHGMQNKQVSIMNIYSWSCPWTISVNSLKFCNWRKQKEEPVCQLNMALVRNKSLIYLKGEFHSSAHACILTGLCTLSRTGPGFSLFINQSWASYQILHANSPKIINRRINCTGQH